MHFVGKNKRFIPVMPLCFALVLVSCQTVQMTRLSLDEQGTILSAAERTFILMNEKRYGNVWESISEKSKDAIVRDVLKACKAFHVTCDGKKLQEDFATGGPDATAYWHNYLETFEPDSILIESIWKMGKAGAEEADILLRHKDSSRDVVLKVVKENGAWRTGLEESFGVRKWMRW
ncbi:MAG: hypothetical protein HPY65_07615 [Syntrophaceae bacterium]|nr:hypothetical protein [Syntrophaceae bacterium]